MQASRKPRRAFAAPLVMTIAMPACVVTSPPPDQTAPPPPPPTTTTATAEPQTQPPAPPPQPDPRVTNPPPPTTTTQQPAPDYPRNWTVKLAADGTCQAFVVVNCKKGATCNPPPPQAVSCPTGIAADRPVQIFAQAGSWDCYVKIDAAACPEKATCNPPPPRKTACP